MTDFVAEKADGGDASNIGCGHKGEGNQPRSHKSGMNYGFIYDEFCIKNGEFFIKNDELCKETLDRPIQPRESEPFCIQKIMKFAF